MTVHGVHVSARDMAPDWLPDGPVLMLTGSVDAVRTGMMEGPVCVVSAASLAALRAQLAEVEKNLRLENERAEERVRERDEARAAYENVNSLWSGEIEIGVKFAREAADRGAALTAALALLGRLLALRNKHGWIGKGNGPAFGALMDEVEAFLRAHGGAATGAKEIDK